MHVQPIHATATGFVTIHLKTAATPTSAQMIIARAESANMIRMWPTAAMMWLIAMTTMRALQIAAMLTSACTRRWRAMTVTFALMMFVITGLARIRTRYQIRYAQE